MTEVQKGIPVPKKRNPRRRKDEVVDKPKKVAKRYKQVPLSEADEFWKPGW